MKITIEKDNYDFKTTSFKTTTTVYETNEVSLFDAFQIINKSFSIIAVNGKYDWKDRLFDGLCPTFSLPAFTAAASNGYPIPLPTLPMTTNWAMNSFGGAPSLLKAEMKDADIPF